ncbi:uncharacterized protein LOC110032285 [Phalaenopsis equestris]|uniref:uncharacterized protein LOC110032285 n=1 Tax=Phalaenopsis equestris TaxID=78828 RepID=UPI0009E485F8|nr:uncharacterized protein LOC110032285 [Phalaenopsis equestris]
MIIPSENVPASPPESPTPSVSSTPPSRLRNAFMSGLHNIDIPFHRTWGRHQVLRCLNTDRKDTINQSERNHQSDDLRERNHIPPSNSPSIVTRPCNRRRTRRVPILKIPCSDVSPPPPPAPLRKSMRKRSVRLIYDNASPPPPPPTPLSRKSVRKRSVRLMPDNLEKREHCPKISISLSRKEIEEDYYTLTGLPPCKRPKKRPRVIKKQLDQLLPGSLLPSITPSKYDVPD